jgi:hypothetical protein
MKRLTPSGHSLVLGSPRSINTVLPFREHVPFFDNGIGWIPPDIDLCASGNFQIFLKWDLKSSTDWVYRIYDPMPIADTIPIFEFWLGFIFVPFNRTYAGLTWNFIQRPLVIDKMTGLEFVNFLATH